MVAIDFTGSNMQHTMPNSLHNISQGLSQYEQAILGVGSIVEYYDFDKNFPVWGFGASFNGQVKHCFTLGNQEQAFRVKGILDLYRREMPLLEFSGPTKFSGVLDFAIRNAKAQKDLLPSVQMYSVLLILTDGCIDDFQETKQLIVDASSLPLSIIIVGIGNSNFDKMVMLDSDKGLLQDNKGRKCVRDIVQFVPFNKFNQNQESLAKEVLAEVPTQLVSFFQSNAVEPMPRPQVQFQF